MKRFGKMALVAAGFSLLALLLFSSLSHPAKADEGWDPSRGPLWTHLGVRSGNVVVLNCVTFSSQTLGQLCTQFDRIDKDGNATAYSGPPKGFSLFVTDVAWQSYGNPPGGLGGVTLFNQSGALRLFANDQTSDANGNASGNINFTAGVVYSGTPYILVNTVGPQLQLIGYFVAN